MKLPPHQFALNLLSLSLIAIALLACQETKENTLAVNSVEESPSIHDGELARRDLSQQFKDYWYAGQAELTSYELEQERYGELRSGTAVHIFVTEDFLPEEQVKADQYSEDNIPILKLNNTKKFLTGIYPYSVMTSSFVPVDRKGHALKVTHSMQEWCGHVYVQLNNRQEYDIKAHSYFEGEADRDLSLEKTWLEDEIWNRIRINPEELPKGNVQMIPSFEFSRLRHKDIGAYDANISVVTNDDNLTSYVIDYPDLKRTLTIHFSAAFPYTIEGWEEVMPSWRQDGEMLSTKATKMERILSPYWTKNSNKDEVLREALGLE